jgi:hypothetical protein
LSSLGCRAWLAGLLVGFLLVIAVEPDPSAIARR